jgi:pimeloyl-ACP methyl ester carboxylesterase
LLFVCGLPKARPNIHERLSARAVEIREGGARGVMGWGPRVSPGVFAPRTLREQPELVGLFERLFEEQVPETYTRIIDVLLAADVNAVVPTVNVPCAAIGGAEDSYAPPEALRAFTAMLTSLPASHAPCVTTVLDGAGHMAFYEQPAAFAVAARTFLDTLR